MEEKKERKGTRNFIRTPKKLEQVAKQEQFIIKINKEI